MKTERHPIPKTGHELRVGHLSDLHYGKTASTDSSLRTALRRLVDVGIDVLVVSGDLAQLPDDHAQLGAVREILDAAGVPYVTVSGNHDVRTPGADGVYAAYFGRLPRVERLAGATFLLFDSFGGLDESERDPADFDPTWECWTDGEVPREQFVEIASHVKPTDELRLAVVHHHLDDEPHPHVNPLRNAEEFLQWCADHDVYGVFVGHLHRPAPPADRGGVMRFRVGRTTKPPYPCAVVDFSAGEYVLLTE